MKKPITKRIRFMAYSHTFRISEQKPNRMFFYIQEYNLDFYDLPEGKWKIINNEEDGIHRFITVQKISKK